MKNRGKTQNIYRKYEIQKTGSYFYYFIKLKNYLLQVIYNDTKIGHLVLL